MLASAMAKTLVNLVTVETEKCNMVAPGGDFFLSFLRLSLDDHEFKAQIGGVGIRVYETLALNPFNQRLSKGDGRCLAA